MDSAVDFVNAVPSAYKAVPQLWSLVNSFSSIMTQFTWDLLGENFPCSPKVVPNFRHVRTFMVMGTDSQNSNNNHNNNNKNPLVFSTFVTLGKKRWAGLRSLTADQLS